MTTILQKMYDMITNGIKCNVYYNSTPSRLTQIHYPRKIEEDTTVNLPDGIIFENIRTPERQYQRALVSRTRTSLPEWYGN